WEGKREEHRNLLKLKYLVDGEKLNDLLGYLEENWESRCQRGSGSGGVEKNNRPYSEETGRLIGGEELRGTNAGRKIPKWARTLLRKSPP
ncbi:hypothetical protein M1N58_01440, partial [Dehalococcoidales bacterium]|nr:hypothetical protein [Dehalococcoidales bacterium]